jgi:CRISPR/Cas system-associated exonuclease Cas4 (RecB family)
MALLPQIPRYVGAARALGMSVREGMYGFIRYRKLNNESDKYKIVPQSFTSKRVQNSFKDLINSGKEILEFKSLSLEEWKDNTSRVANNLVCKSCSFRELCVAELNGSDGKVIREVDFEVNTRYGYVEGELE